MPTPRWLNDHEARAWIAYIDLSRLLGDYLEQHLQRDAGMSHGDYMLISYLSQARDRSVRLTELATFLKITRSRLSHTLTRLERSGWVQRRSAPDDGRGQLAVLTDKGFAILSEAAPGHVEAVRAAVFDHLNADQVRQLTEIAETVTGALAEVDERAAYPAALPWRRR